MTVPGTYYSRSGKRLCDAVASAILLVVTAPVMGACALAIRAESGRPVIFDQQRAGQNGVPFTLHKFRSMKVGTHERSGGYPTPAMVTKVGAVLRRTSLDELPQLWNILRGDMSFVGPRPALLDQVARYSPAQRQRLATRPGLTGLAQIRFRNSAPWSVRIESDVEYVRNQSLLTDMSILLRTVPVALFGDGQRVGQTAAQIDDLGQASI